MAYSLALITRLKILRTGKLSKCKAQREALIFLQAVATHNQPERTWLLSKFSLIFYV
jgi:hypothetical protein